MVWNISEWLLSSLPAESIRGFMLDIYCGNLVKLLEVNLIIFGGPLYDCPLKFLIQSCLHKASRYSSIMVQIFLVWSCSQCFLLVSAQVNHDSVYLLVSPILGAEVCPVLSFLLLIQEEFLIL